MSGPTHAAATPRTIRLTGDRLLLAGIIVLAAALRLYRLGYKGLWGDEIWTAIRAQTPFPQVFSAFMKPPLMPNLYVFTHLSTRFGESEFWVRLPAALFGAIGVYVFFRLADIALSRRTALVAALLLALSPFHIWYSQDARYYAILCTLGISSAYFLYVFLTTPDRMRTGHWLAFLLVTALAIYTHIFAWWVILGEGLFVAYWLARDVLAGRRAGKGMARMGRNKLILLVVGFLLLLAISAPVILALTRTLESGTGDTGESLAQFRLPPDVPYFFKRDFFAGMARYFSGGRLATWLFVPAMLVGLASIWRRNRDLLVLILSLAVMPFLTSFFLQFLHAVEFRYFIHLLPIYLLLVAEGFRVLTSLAAATIGGLACRAGRADRFLGPYGLQDGGDNLRIQPKVDCRAMARSWQHSPLADWLLLPVLLAAFILLAGKLSLVYRQAQINDWRAASRYLESQIQPADIVLAELWGPPALDYYFPIRNNAVLFSVDDEKWRDIRELGPTIWFIGLDDRYEKSLVECSERLDYEAIPATAWHDPALLYPDAPGNTDLFPVTEFPADLYRIVGSQQAASIDFRDIVNAEWTTESYREIPAGRQSQVSLTLAAVAPRLLRFRYADLPGKDLQVSIDGQIIGYVPAGQQGGGWQTWQIPLPSAAGDQVLVTFRAAGQETAGLSWVALTYADEPAGQASRPAQASDGTIDGAGWVEFPDIQDATWTDEQYRHLDPGDEIILHWQPSQAESQVSVRFFDHPGKCLEVWAGDAVVDFIPGGQHGGGWVERTARLPAQDGEDVLIVVRSVGADAAGVSRVEISPAGGAQ